MGLTALGSLVTRNSPVSSLPMPLNKKSKDASVQCLSDSEVKYSQNTTENTNYLQLCALFHLTLPRLTGYSTLIDTTLYRRVTQGHKVQAIKLQT